MEDAIKQAQLLAQHTATTASKLTQHLLDKTKEFGFTNYYDSTDEEIEKDLESTVSFTNEYEKDKLGALKRLIALMSRGEDVKKYFAAVIKQVAFPSFQVKKLIYLYLLKYAETEPDLSLLSINTFQKDLSDPNPMIRTVALRVMSSIKVPLIVPIITASFKKGITDLSPYVRKAVAISILKCHLLDPSQDPILLEIIEVLLNDKSTIVLGPTIHVLVRLFPSKLDLLHKHFKKICRLLIEADEWSQLQMIRVMIRYCHVYFTYHENMELLDADLQLFISSIKMLLYSRNPLVVLVISVFFYELGYADLKSMAVKSLIRSLTRPKQEQYMLLVAMKEMVILDKTPWLPHLGTFRLYKGEMMEISKLKLEILEILATDQNANDIFQELRACVYSTNTKLAIHAILVWKRFAMRVPSICPKTIQVLISLLSHSDATLVGEVVISIRKLIQDTDTQLISKDALIAYLVSIYSSVSVPLARASILWLVRNQPAFRYAADCLRIALLDFCDQDKFVKRQILQLALLLKVTIVQGQKSMFIQLAYDHVFKLAKYDVDVDVRDYARLYDGLSNPTTESIPHVVKLLTTLSASKEFQEHTRIFDSLASKFRIGTLSQLLDVAVSQYEELPNWAEKVGGSKERNEVSTESWSRDRVIASTVKTIKRVEKKRVVNLEEFYADVQVAGDAVSESGSQSDSESSSDSDSDSGSDSMNEQ